MADALERSRTRKSHGRPERYDTSVPIRNYLAPSPALANPGCVAVSLGYAFHWKYTSRDGHAAWIRDCSPNAQGNYGSGH